MEAALSNIEDLKGDALDSALEAVGLLEGNKSKSVEEKRDLLREREQQAGSAGTVNVRVAWPVDSLDTGIDGVGVIRYDVATPVAKGQLDAVKAAADSANVELIAGRG